MKKLVLNKESVRMLSEAVLGHVVGAQQEGPGDSYPVSYFWGCASKAAGCATADKTNCYTQDGCGEAW